MAHSPEKKAAVVADLLSGIPQREVAKKHQVDRKTVIAWGKEVHHNSTAIAVRKEQDFDAALKSFLFSTVAMLSAWATECADPKFIRENPRGVNELGQTVLDRAERILSSIRDETERKPIDGEVID